MSGRTWDFDQARLWTDESGQEWLCIPWDPESTYPEQLRRVADQWDAENSAER